MESPCKFFSLMSYYILNLYYSRVIKNRKVIKLGREASDNINYLVISKKNQFYKTTNYKILFY